MLFRFLESYIFLRLSVHCPVKQWTHFFCLQVGVEWISGRSMHMMNKLYGQVKTGWGMHVIIISFIKYVNKYAYIWRTACDRPLKFGMFIRQDMHNLQWNPPNKAVLKKTTVGYAIQSPRDRLFVYKTFLFIKPACCTSFCLCNPLICHFHKQNATNFTQLV